MTLQTKAPIHRILSLLMPSALLTMAMAWSFSLSAQMEADIDGDGDADFVIWRPTNLTLYTKTSDTFEILHRRALGENAWEVPLIADLDGDDKADFVSWEPTTGQWLVAFNNGETASFQSGAESDIPFLGDKDGDGNADLITYSGDGSWCYLASSGGYEQSCATLAQSGNGTPVPADYDGDGQLDYAIWESGSWQIWRSSDGEEESHSLGRQAGDVAVPADYDGDGKADKAIWRPSNGTWYIDNSSDNSRVTRVFGKQQTDIPIPADYDGDNKADFAIRRPTTSEFIYLSSAEDRIYKTVFGKQDSDIAVLAPWQLKQDLLQEAPAQSDDSDTGSDTDSNSDPVSQADVDGDGDAEFAIWRPGNLTFYTKTADTFEILQRQIIGANNWEVPLMGDVDGNGLADLVTWAPDSGFWNVIYDNGQNELFHLGERGDYPFLGDRDGDGKSDFVVRKPDSGSWCVLASSNQFSESCEEFADDATDVPVPGDYDNDGKLDFAVWRSGSWMVLNSSDSTQSTVVLGKQASDIAVPGDYDGDGQTDRAIWRPTNGTWYIDYSSDNSRFTRVFGKQSTDIPVPADYDGDGKTDLAIRRPTNYEFIYLSSRSNDIVRNVFGKQDTDIPVLAAWQLKQTLLNAAPEEDDDESLQGQELYNNSISGPIIQSRCINCHISGGAADGLARLLFEPESTADYQSLNQQIINDFLGLSGVDADYFLSKASGGNSHGGGVQVIPGGEDYEALQRWLAEITNDQSSSNQDSDFWENIILEDCDLTYRRAAIMFGSLPDTAVVRATVAYSEEALRVSLLDLMQGLSFHHFLKRGANDQLLIRGAEYGALDPNSHYFPALNHKLDATRVDEEHEEENQEVIDEFYTFLGRMLESYLEAPLELIAYVIQNDRAYSEILTADYTMLSPYLNEAWRGDAEGFEDLEDPLEFKPGRVHGIMLNDGTGEYSYDNGFSIITEGTNVSLPHAGLLNELAWLGRYRTTATNRNRARARWTYYHFLDFDIEKSVQRTQNSDDLVDTDNPTMNNPNCSVCHQLLDPVAGAYKLYYEAGRYKFVGGDRALHPSYELAPDSLYQPGDTWYRDMREPGFEGSDTPEDRAPLQWLSQQIVADPRFAISAVKFWWPAIMGSEPLFAPEEESDSDYNDRLSAFTAQNQFINQLADSLREHWNMKQIFADMLMSPWYRAKTVDGNLSAAQQLALSGSESLLGPEALSQKTKLITGMAWRERTSDSANSELVTALNDEDIYLLAYGGIDSVAITERARDLTPVMAKVALAQASEMACPVVMEDFLKPDNERKLFQGISRYISPGVVEGASFQVTGNNQSNAENFEFEGDTSAGAHQLTIVPLIDSRRPEENLYQQLVIERITITDGTQNTLVDINGNEFSELGGSVTCGGEINSNHWTLNRRCEYQIPFELNTSGEVSVSITAYLQNIRNNELLSSDEGTSMVMDAWVAHTSSSDNSNAEGKIRESLVELHYRLLGEKLTTDHESIDISYSLFMDVYQRTALRNSGNTINEQNVWCRTGFIEYPYYNAQNQYIEWDSAEYDPTFAMRAWKAVMAFMLSDHKFLHDS